MAAHTVTTTSTQAVLSTEGGVNYPDGVVIRLAKGSTGTVWIERSATKAHASTATSIYITDTETYNTTLVAGEGIQVITDGSSIDIVIDAPATAIPA